MKWKTLGRHVQRAMTTIMVRKGQRKHQHPQTFRSVILTISGQVQRAITTIMVHKGQRKYPLPLPFNSVITVAMTSSRQVQRAITTIMVQKRQIKYPLPFRIVIPVAMSKAASWKTTAFMNGLITSTNNHIQLQDGRLIRAISRWKRRKRQIKNGLLT